MKEEVLQSFGLTNAEVRVYIALLSEGESTASGIAKMTGANRTFTYDRLKKLGDVGLVSSIIKDNRKYFKAAQPSQLLSMLKEREEQIKDILPELERLRRPGKNVPEVEVYSTVRGVKTAMNLMLKEGHEIYLHGTLRRFKEAMPVYFDIWDKRRVRRDIRMKVLSSEAVKLELAESDLLPEEEQAITSTFTFGETVLTIMWGDHPVAILIRSREIAGNSVAFFNAAWEREVKIYSGMEGMWRAFMELLEDGKEYFGYGYNKRLADAYTVEFSDRWHAERLKNGVVCRIISFDDEASKSYFRPRVKPNKDFHVRFLGREFQEPACVTMTDKKLVIFVYTEERFRVIVNRNREAVKAYRRYFDELWSKAKT